MSTQRTQPNTSQILLKSSLMLKVGKGHLSDGFREQDKDMPDFVCVCVCFCKMTFLFWRQYLPLDSGLLGLLVL